MARTAAITFDFCGPCCSSSGRSSSSDFNLRRIGFGGGARGPDEPFAEFTVAETLSSAWPSLFTVLKGPAPSDGFSACPGSLCISTSGRLEGCSDAAKA